MSSTVCRGFGWPYFQKTYEMTCLAIHHRQGLWQNNPLPSPSSSAFGYKINTGFRASMDNRKITSHLYPRRKSLEISNVVYRAPQKHQ